MAKEVIHTNIEGQKVKLSNLSKVLYPELGVTKAEIIQYYMEVAPLMLPHVKDRALTLIRFPDGVQKKGFYTKSAPDWRPEWIDTMPLDHSKETIHYVVVTNTASLIWIANLAGLEMHPMQFTRYQEYPDHFIFDLDPENDQAFDDLKELSFRLKEFLLGYDYYPFLKTSGGKGLHLLIPIEPKWPQDQMVESVKALARQFVKENPGIATLKMNKEKRQGKTLIDIFRNHRGHTTVAAFSLRGKHGAPVSLPIHWDQLAGVEDSKSFNIRNYRAYLDEHGYAWDKWRDYSAPLHDRKDSVPVSDIPLDQSQLKSYAKKRDFDRTNEPPPVVLPGDDSNYVIQLHNASNLHYDLRLEVAGVLKSWAIPKGLPHVADRKRLAIQTEDHPMKYLTFEGTIPKGQYGAGEMWVYDTGKIEWIEKKETKYKFTLNNSKYKRSYSIYNTKGEQWLIETLDTDENKMLKFFDPMLAGVSKIIPKSSDYVYEIKWDGIRAVICVDGKEMKIYSRSGREISKNFPELIADRKYIKAEAGIFDSEIVCLDEQGRPQFSNVISRMHTSGATNIEKGAKRLPVTCYLFDCMNLDGKEITKLPLIRRREWVRTVLKDGSHFRYSDHMDDGEALFKAAEQMGLEGIMAKKKSDKYYPGARTDAWLKIKFRQTTDALIIGYTEGQGDRAHLFGSLHLAQEVDGKLVYKGRVGSGFDTEKMKTVLALLQGLETTKKPIDDQTDKERESTWVTPKLYCEIKYASMSSNDTYREPVFLRMRPDLYKKD